MNRSPNLTGSRSAPPGEMGGSPHRSESSALAAAAFLCFSTAVLLLMLRELPAFHNLAGQLGSFLARVADYLWEGQTALILLVLLRVTGKGTIASFLHREGDGWEKGPYGIPEPPRRRGTRPRAGGFDLVVVPGVAFDREGRRLGHGFGYYDRFLATLPEGVTRVGLAYAHQVIPEVPVDAWDVPVHALVTEEGVIRAAHAPGAPTI